MRSSAVAALAVAIVLVASALACATASPSGDAARGSVGDSITFVVDNRNYLDVTVRLFSDDRQVERLFVVGHTVDTFRLPRSRFAGTSWFRAVVSPVGKLQEYPLPRELLPEDASLVLIDVSEHLP